MIDRARENRMPAHDPMVELQRLQTDTIEALEAIAADIRSGRLGAEQGSAKAKAIIAASEQQRVAMFEAAMSAAQRQRRRGWLFALLAVVLMAAMLAGLLLARIAASTG